MKAAKVWFNTEQNKGTLYFSNTKNKWIGRVWKEGKRVSFRLGNDRDMATKKFNEILKDTYGENARLRRG